MAENIDDGSFFDGNNPFYYNSTQMSMKAWLILMIKRRKIEYL